MEATKSAKLAALREEIEKQYLDGYLQPVHDEYLNEYPPACNRRVEWLTGFTGSAGMVAVLIRCAALFVDGRYSLQAEMEIDAGLYERYNSADLSPEAWIAQHVNSGDCIGYDPRLYTQAMLSRLQKTFESKNIALVPVSNLVDSIWKDRPPKPASPVFIHPTTYAGEKSSCKRARIAAILVEEGADSAVITAADAVCWLLNIRARDVEHTPLALATLVIDTKGLVKLFLQRSRCDEAVLRHLGPEVVLCEPSEMEIQLTALGKGGKQVLYDHAATPLWFTQALSKSGAQLIAGQDPCQSAKAIKNAVEQEGICNAHIRDGAAVVKLLCWLDGQALLREVSELEVCDKLLTLRQAQPLFLEPSFSTIAGSGPHGAIVHYRATPASNRILKQGELFLLDSGAQYHDGTTDITRTVAIGDSNREQRDRFTRVLKGHIAIATAVFPEGTTGSQLDVLARQHLWQIGLDYDHGTGHGVGCFLGVHEGPQRISKRGGDAVLAPGMLLSNEPGYYKMGAYGIRIENLVMVSEQPQYGQSKRWLAFETVTCAPIDTRLIETSLLTPMEKQWLNAYHAWVLESLESLLDMQERLWLAARCAPIS